MACRARRASAVCRVAVPRAAPLPVDAATEYTRAAA